MSAGKAEGWTRGCSAERHEPRPPNREFVRGRIWMLLEHKSSQSQAAFDVVMKR